VLGCGAIDVDEVARGSQIVWDEVELQIRGKLGALKVFDEIEDDAVVWRMGYPHSACLKVLVLLVVEVMSMDPSSDAIRALEDMNEVACALEKEGSIEACHPTSDNSNRGWTNGHL
jgi:hypothetical protein